MSDLTLLQGWIPLKLDVNPYYEGYTFFKNIFFLNYWYIIEDTPFPVIIFSSYWQQLIVGLLFFHLLWIHPVLDLIIEQEDGSVYVLG